jgi:autotransporter-associated beta strand protein
MKHIFKLILLGVGLSFPWGAFGQSIWTWDGGGANNNWSDNNNWNPDSAVSYGIQNFAGSTRLDNTNNLAGTFSTHRWFFNSGAGAFTISGNAVRFFDFSGNDPKIENNSSNTQTINLNIEGDGDAGDPLEINPVSGSLVLNGTVNNQGSNIRVFGNNGHTLTLNGIVSGAGKLIVEQDSRVVLNAVNTYTGNTEINAGQIRIGSGGDIASGSAIYLGNGGTPGTSAKFFLNTDANGKTFSRTINVNNGDGTSGNREIGFLSSTTSDVGTFSGSIARSGSSRVLSLYSGGARTIFSGDINGSDTVIISSAANGLVEYQGSKTYTGDTSIRRGELRISSGSGPSSGTIYVGEGGSFIADTATLSLGAAGSSGGLTLARTIQVNTLSAPAQRVLAGHNTSGVNTFSGNVTLQSFAHLQAATGGTVDFTGIISQSGGTFGITKIGGGTAKLSGANTYQGQTSIDAGTLQLGNDNRVSDSSALYIASGATLDMNNFTEEFGNFVTSAGNVINLASTKQLRVNQTSTETYSGTISGAGDFVKKGTAALTFSGANSYSGATFIDAGELRYAANQAGGYNGTIHLGATSGSDAAVLAITNSGVTISNPITVRSGSSGSKSIIARNTSGLATFSGSVLISNVLNVTATSGGNLTLGGNITMHDNNITNTTTSTTTLAGQISGTGKIVKQGTGTLTLSGNNLYTGNTEIDQGTLAVSGDIANGSTTYIGNGGAGFSSANATLTLAANGVDLGGNIQVNTSAGSGSRTIAATATSGNTTISGGLTVNKDVAVQANSGSALTISGNVTVNNSSVISVSGANNVTISGNISGAGAQLSKSGSGQLILSGVNTYSGATTLSGGTLQITPGDSITSATTINSGTMVVHGTAGNVTINSGGFLKGSGTVGTLAVSGSFSPGNSPGTLASGSTTWNNGGSYIWELNDVDAGAGTDPGWDLLDVTGTLDVVNNFTIYVTSLTLANSSGLVHDFNTLNNYTWLVAQTTGGLLNYTAGDVLLNLSGFTNPYGGTWAVSNSANNVYITYTGAPLSASAIPEPSMAILMVVGAAVLYARRRRARRVRL